MNLPYPWLNLTQKQNRFFFAMDNPNINSTDVRIFGSLMTETDITTLKEWNFFDWQSKNTNLQVIKKSAQLYISCGAPSGQPRRR